MGEMSAFLLRQWVWQPWASIFCPISRRPAATLSFRKQDAASIRRYGLISSPCWLIYNIGVLSLGAIICEVLSPGSILIGMGRLDKQKYP